MSRKTIVRRAALGAALLVAVGASAAYAHGTADQSNDPVADHYYWCNGRTGGRLQGFTPSKRLLSSLDLRLLHQVAVDAPVVVAVRQGSPSGTVLGSAGSSVSATGPVSPLVHFDFSPPLVLEPEGTFVIELVIADPTIVQWVGRQDNPYAGGTGYGCNGGSLAKDDFNFVTFLPADGGPPDTIIQAGPLDGSITRDASADLLFTGTDDLSYTGNLVAACELDGQPYAPCASPLSLEALRDGLHSFAVRTTDQAGQRDATPATVAWTIDTKPPSRPRVDGPRRAERARATYRFSARDAVARPRQLRFRCALDSRRLTSCANRIVRRLSEGRHVLRVVAVDQVGNVSGITAVDIVRS